MTQNDKIERLVVFVLIFWWLLIPIGLLLFAIGAFFSVFYTVLNVVSLIKPFWLFGYPFDRETSLLYLQASWGIGLLVPSFIFFCELLFGLRIEATIYQYAFIAGYVIGGLGPDAWDYFYLHYIYTYTPYRLPQHNFPSIQGQQELLPPSASTYRYASWDDEEARR